MSIRVAVSLNDKSGDVQGRVRRRSYHIALLWLAGKFYLPDYPGKRAAAHTIFICSVCKEGKTESCSPLMKRMSPSCRFVISEEGLARSRQRGVTDESFEELLELLPENLTISPASLPPGSRFRKRAQTASARR